MQYEFFKPSRKILLQRFKIRQSEDSLRVFREEGRVVKLDIRLSRIHFAALSRLGWIVPGSLSPIEKRKATHEELLHEARVRERG